MNQQIQIGNVMTDALATGLFVSLCTITELPSPVVLGPSGSPTAAYVAVSGMSNILCIMAVMNPNNSPNVDEHDAVPESMTVADLHVLLEAYYRTITTAMRAVIDGVTYDIVTVQRDSQRQMTRMRVRAAAI